MPENESIKELLRKFVQNDCDEKEVRELVDYFNKAKGIEAMPSMEDIENWMRSIEGFSEMAPTLTSQEVLKMAKQRERNFFKRKFWQYVAVAALFIGIVVTAHLVLKESFGGVKDDILVPVDEVITLQMEDGTKKTINEKDVEQLFDAHGNLVGRQQGGKITYNLQEAGTPSDVLVYNTLWVPYGKRFALELSDGTSVQLNSGTTLKYPVQFLPGMDRRVELTGEAFFKVAKDLEHPFVINAEDLNVEVLGTEFNISNYPEDSQTDVVLVEGSVALYQDNSSIGDKGAVTLVPGTKGSFDRKEHDIKTQEVSTELYTAWISGELVFRKMSFDNILRKLERHYHIEIENTNQELGKELFNASFGNEPLERVFETLHSTYGIMYVIEDNKVIVH